MGVFQNNFRAFNNCKDIVGLFRTISSERNRNNRPEQLIINSGSCKTSLKKNGAGKSVTADSIRYVIKAKKYTIFEGFT